MSRNSYPSFKGQEKDIDPTLALTQCIGFTTQIESSIEAAAAGINTGTAGSTTTLL